MDIHRKTAAKLFGMPEDQITPEQRKAGKAANFHHLYGGNSETFLKQYTMPKVTTTITLELQKADHDHFLDLKLSPVVPRMGDKRFSYKVTPFHEDHAKNLKHLCRTGLIREVGYENFWVTIAGIAYLKHYGKLPNTPLI